jgi:hypothetical protein
MNSRHFRKIPGFPGYLIAKTGTIYSLKTKRYLKLRSLDNLKGYPRVDLFFNGTRSRFFVHRLVATTYHKNPENKPQVNHLDWNVKNFHANNLEWCTQSENIRYNRKRPGWGTVGLPGKKWVYVPDPVCGF